jgi:hypothetical protein
MKWQYLQETASYQRYIAKHGKIATRLLLLLALSMVLVSVPKSFALAKIALHLPMRTHDQQMMRVLRRPQSRNSRIKKLKKKKPTAVLKATYYKGYRGAYGKLKGKAVALNAAQRKRLKIAKREKVYLDFPRRYNGFDGWYKVLDCGCRAGVIDVWYRNYGSAMSKTRASKRFRRAGVIGRVKVYGKRKWRKLQ